MAFVAIPNNDQYEYDNDPPDPGVGHPMRALWLKSSNGIRTEHGHSNYVRCRRIGSGDVDHGELSKSYWDARGDEDDLEPFTMTVRTTAANETFTIPCQNVGTFNATVDWGDGSSSTVATYNDANLVHTYTSAGDHAISISGTFPNIYFAYTGDRTKVIAVTNLGQVGWQTFKSAFMGCEYMTTFNFGTHTDTSSITDMSGMFRACERLPTINLSTLNTSSVTDFSRMFEQVMWRTPGGAGIDVSNLDTSSGINFSGMFSNMSHLTSIDVSSFDTSNATNMSSMFNGLINLTSIDVTNFDTSNVTRMSSMFNSMFGITSLDVTNFDTSNVLYMSSMFQSCLNLTSLDVSNFDTSSVVGTTSMFTNTNALAVIDVSNFDTSNVRNFSGMFRLGSNNNLSNLIGVENFDYEGISQYNALRDFMTNIALPTSRYDQLLINLDASTIAQGGTATFGSSQYTAGGAAEAARANLISTDGWTIIDGGALPVPFAMTVRTTAANETFAIPCDSVGTFNATVDWGDGSTSAITAYNDSDLTHTYASSGDHSISISGTFPNIKFGNNSTNAGKVITVTSLGQVGWQSFVNAFKSCGNMTSFNVGVTDTSSVTSMLGMFQSCHLLTTLDLSNFDTSSVTDMSYMFNENLDLTSLDVSSFNTSSVTTMYRMFYDCGSLTSLDVSSFDTSSVSSFGFIAMFERMYDLTSLDLSNFNTSSASALNNMFYLCRSLTSLDVSSFNTSSVTSMDQMFVNCNSLTSLDVSNFDTSSVTSLYKMFVNCNSLTSLDVSNFNTSSAASMLGMFDGCSSLTDVVGVENFNIEALDQFFDLNSFMSGVTLPTSRYDALLVNWDAQDPFDNMTPNFGSSQYTAGSAAATARANLISTDGWTISDGGTAPPLPFAMTVRTTAANETFTIPCQNVGTFNATIDWGDGSSSTITSYNDSNLAHTYASAGDHAISISGTFPNIKFGDDNVAADKVITVTNLGQVGWQTLERAFKYCDNMTSFTSGVTDTSSVTNMYEIFYSCSDMTSCDASGFNTSNVTNMGGMFRYNYDLTSLDISSFDTSSATSMYGTFWACQSLTSLDVSNFDTSSVTNMFYMFIDCPSLTSLDVSNFDTSSVTDMNGMFFGGSSLTDVVGVENFNIEGINNTGGFTNFMNSVTLPTARYDALLVNWDAQDPLDNLVPNFGSSQYTAGGTAAAARANLISTDGWTITDGGTV